MVISIVIVVEQVKDQRLRISGVMDMDAKTGLPVVPEGCFWRIRERPAYRFGSEQRTDDGKLWVELCTEGMVMETYKTRPALTWKNIWIYFLLEDSVTAVREVPGVVIHAEAMMAEYKSFEWDSMSEAASEGYTQSASQNPYSYTTNYVRLMDATTENVRKVATSVLKTYTIAEEEMRAAELKAQQRQALVGTYPPKKLED